MLILQTATVPGTFSPFLSCSTISTHHIVKPISISCSVSTNSGSKPESESNPSSKLRSKNKGKSSKPEDDVSVNKDGGNLKDIFPTTIPRKPRRGRKSEAMKVEDFVRDRLKSTFAAIRQQNGDALKNHSDIMKDSVSDDPKAKRGDDDSDKEEEDEEGDGD